MANIVTSTRVKVKRYLKEIYGRNYKNMVEEVEQSFIIRRGSAAVHVSVKPLSKNDCIVNALSYVVQGAKIGPKVLGLLMRRNATYPIGAYGLLFDDTIVFSHSIAGANLDPNELRTTIATVAFVADETDDEIRAMSGGLRAVDAIGIMDTDSPSPGKRKRNASTKKASVGKKAPAKKKATPTKKSSTKAVPRKKAAPPKRASKKK
ncbi:YbjN domain-containing protein [bacterium]|nr:YbjN domain-containing protein [bacterium]